MPYDLILPTGQRIRHEDAWYESSGLSEWVAIGMRPVKRMGNVIYSEYVYSKNGVIENEA